jgi:hypothetical protein
MFLKPKHTYLDQPALHYKKIIDIAEYFNSNPHFYYQSGDVYKNYVFDRNTETFVDADTELLTGVGILIDGSNTYQYSNKYFKYDTTNLVWTTITQDQATETIISVSSNNVYRGQKNRYIKDRYFDYTIISDINENEQQIGKGLISDTKSFDIKYTDDEVNIKDDDIIQIENELRFVSETQYKVIRLPKPFKTYFCTLTRLKI